MQTPGRGSHSPSTRLCEADSYASPEIAIVTPAPQDISSVPGMKHPATVDDARKRSSISKLNGGRVPGSKLSCNEFLVSQSHHLPESMDNNHQSEATYLDRDNIGGRGQERHFATLARRPCMGSDAGSKASALQHGLLECGGATDAQVRANVEGFEKSVYSADEPAFQDGTPVFHEVRCNNLSATAVVNSFAEAKATVPSALYSEVDSGAKSSSTEPGKCGLTSNQQRISLTAGEDTLRDRGVFKCSTELVFDHTLSDHCVQVEFPVNDRVPTPVSGKSEGAKAPSSHILLAPNNRLRDTGAITDNASDSRRMPMAVREMLRISDQTRAGSPRIDVGDSLKASSVAAVTNPLKRSNASRMGNHRSTSDTHYLYGDGGPGTQSGTIQEQLHPRRMSDDTGAEAHHKTNGLADGLSFASYRGALEWLQVPSLFYLFANIIKWNELQLQRRESQARIEESHTRSSNGSFSIASIWTQNRERELHALEGHISFAVHELQGIYLNRLLVAWSRPKLRSLVADVASTWGTKGPYSSEFDHVSALLFDAISKEQSCQLRSTCLLSVRQWLGSAQHRWAVTCVLMAFLAISIVCIVFFALFSGTQIKISIPLSVVLGVVVVSMHVIAVFILHHNTYADAAARYFRQEAVRAAQRRMEEEELGEEGGEGSMDTHGHHPVLEAPQNSEADVGRVVHLTGDEDAMGTEEEYLENEISLAVRNLRALTEGGAQSDPRVPPSYYLSSQPHSGKGGRGNAGCHVCDEMTLEEENFISLNSRSLQTCDMAGKQTEKDAVHSPHLSCLTSEQQQHQQQQQSKKMGHDCSLMDHKCTGPPAVLYSAGPTIQDSAAGTTRVQGGRGVEDSGICGSDGHPVAGVCSHQNSMTLVEQGLRSSKKLREVNVTVVVFCSHVGVLSQVAPSLWERHFIVLCVTNFQALQSTIQHHSEHCRVILIHALDVAEGSPALGTALSWLQVEDRPVYFFSLSPTAYPVSVPLCTRLLVPFSPTALNTLYLVGTGVGADLSCIPFPVLLQVGEAQHQQSSPSHPLQVPPYTLGRRLGGGAFGNVFEAEMEHTGAKCAVKRMYLKEDSGQDEDQQMQQGGSDNAAATGGSANGSRTLAAGLSSTPSHGDVATVREMSEVTTEVGTQLREIAQEVEIMSSLQHPNIVRYYYCERDDNCISIFMELCTGGSLTSLIHSGRLVNPPEIKQLLREIISAVSYLHHMRIVHRDLKPDNVLFRHGHIKITDFGTAVHKHGGNLRLIKGTFAYMAPEILVGDPYGRACDVWSIGCIAAEVLSVELPQHSLGLPEMCEYYRSMGENSELPIECGVPGVRDFLLACLQRNPNERSTAAELFYHPILQARDTSIHAWMVEMAARRRRTQQRRHQQQTFHRHGLSARTGVGTEGQHHVSSKSLNSSGGMKGAHIDEGFDLHSDGRDAQSLDSSELMRPPLPPPPPPPDAARTVSEKTQRSS